MDDKEISRAIEKLKFLQTLDDTETAHAQADDILCGLLPKEIVAEYNKISKWYA